MIAITSGKRSVYVFNNHWNRGNTVCQNKARVKRAEVEAAVVETISEGLLHPDTVELICEKANRKLDRALSAGAHDHQVLIKQLEDEQRQLKNLIDFVMAGDTSSAVRQRIQEKEASINALNREIQSPPAREPADGNRINKRWVVQRLKNLGQLMTSTKESLKLAQIELKNLLKGKIVLSTEDAGEFHRVRGLIRARLSTFLPQPLSVMVYGGGGNRTPVRI